MASSGEALTRADLSAEAIRLGRLLAGLLSEAEVGRLLGLLLRIEPSPVVELNRAVVVAMRDGSVAGLELINTVLASGELDDYQPAHAARADLCRRLGKNSGARVAYERALKLYRQEPQRRFLQRRLESLWN